MEGKCCGGMWKVYEGRESGGEVLWLIYGRWEMERVEGKGRDVGMCSGVVLYEKACGGGESGRARYMVIGVTWVRVMTKRVEGKICAW